MSHLIPEGMNKEQLCEVLEDIIKRVRDGDSYEGNIEYLIPDSEPSAGWPSVAADFWVSGCYRIGNLQGQGGMRMIGTLPPA